MTSNSSSTASWAPEQRDKRTVSDCLSEPTQPPAWRNDVRPGFGLTLSVPSNKDRCGDGRRPGAGATGTPELSRMPVTHAMQRSSKRPGRVVAAALLGVACHGTAQGARMPRSSTNGTTRSKPPYLRASRRRGNPERDSGKTWHRHARNMSGRCRQAGCPWSRQRPKRTGKRPHNGGM